MPSLPGRKLSVLDRDSDWARLTAADSEFDLLVVGGGITGAAVARDAASRGLKVALVERSDYASGTSSRSSKLIHGGLRYLENFEFKLVFEALRERSFLLRTAPHMVRPLPFYFPVYEGDLHGKGLIRLGLFLYDLLSLFRAPGLHKSYSPTELACEIPALKREGSKGGLRYFDASMWDDVLVTETLRSAVAQDAVSFNYVEVSALEKDPEGRARGALLKDRLGGREGRVRARQVVACVGAWSDRFGRLLDPDWKPWLKPSQGIHLVFDARRLPVPGAVVMSHPEDGRISFVIPRPDLGAGVTIVGTTDAPSPEDPEAVNPGQAEIDYLFRLLDRFFPSLQLTPADLVSTYVGVRPLIGPGDPKEQATLAKVSREHEIRLGPGAVVMVAGGKYTTHREMAEEIVDFALKHAPPEGYSCLPGHARTRVPVNPLVSRAGQRALARDARLPAELISRFGGETEEILRLDAEARARFSLTRPDPEGFPALAGQLVFALREEGVVTLRDFYFRRAPLYLSRRDHGLPWASELARVWAGVRGLSEREALGEAALLADECATRDAWRSG